MRPHRPFLFARRVPRAAHALLCLSVIAGLTLAGVTFGGGSARADDWGQPCSDPLDQLQTWEGNSQTTLVSIPAHQPTEQEQYYNLGIPYSFDGEIFAPPNETPVPAGGFPAVILAHGHGGDKCNLSWLAQDLAGHGYVTLVFTVCHDQDLCDSSQAQASDEMDAIDSSIGDLEESFNPSNLTGNPYLSVTNTNNIALVGHSEGAIAVSTYQAQSIDFGDGVGFVPNDSYNPAVKTIVGLDNLVHTVMGDTGHPGKAGGGCTQPVQNTFEESVPALGLASIRNCMGIDPPPNGPDMSLRWNKENAFNNFRAASQPSMELAMRDFVHKSFGLNCETQDEWASYGSQAKCRNATNIDHQEIAYYTLAWFDYFLEGQTSAENQLLSPTMQMDEPAGSRQTDQVLQDPVNGYHQINTRNDFCSGAYLPGVDTDDFQAWVDDHQTAQCPDPLPPVVS